MTAGALAGRSVAVDRKTAGPGCKNTDLIINKHHPLKYIKNQSVTFSATFSTCYRLTFSRLLFPSVFAAHFYRQRHSLGFAISGVWLGENLLNIARYMANVRAQQLPLVSGGDHDWAFIFSHWGMLAADTRFAVFTRLIGICLMLGAVCWLWRRRRA